MNSETLSLIVVSDETSPVRRFELRKSLLKRGLWGAGIIVGLLLVLLVDYVRVRVDNRELNSLRAETIERRSQVAEFQQTLSGVDRQLSALTELERKIRIIANLPGAGGTGGENISAVGPEHDPDDGQGGESDESLGNGGPAGSSTSRVPKATEEATVEERVSLLRDAALYLGAVAEGQETSLLGLVDALEGKRRFLESSPSIWPAKGWLTSRFGYRTSPFTSRRQFHSGIDIAGAPGTDIVAPARGKVIFAGKRGPLGNTVIIEHGYGVKTTYGHIQELFVKRSEEVERGQRIASLGNTGRSTGPHLHYVIEVKGKTRNPLDYIFD